MKQKCKPSEPEDVRREEQPVRLQRKGRIATVVITFSDGETKQFSLEQSSLRYRVIRENKNYIVYKALISGKVIGTKQKVNSYKLPQTTIGGIEFQTAKANEATQTGRNTCHSIATSFAAKQFLDQLVPETEEENKV